LDGLALHNGASVKFHTGTSETTAAVYLLEGDRVPSGERTLIQVQLNQPIVAGPLDRFIVRSLSPVQTIGGGTIIEAIDRKLRRSRPEIVEDAKLRAIAVQDDAAFAEYVIRTAPDHATTVKAVAQRIKKTLPATERLVQAIIQSGAVLSLEQGLLVHAKTADKLKQQILDRLARYHQTDPASPGMDMDSCQIECTWPKPMFLKFLKDLESQNKVRILDGRVSLADHRAKFDPAKQRCMQQVDSLFQQRLFNPPEPMEIMTLCQLNAKELEDTLRLLTEHGRLVRIARDLYFHSDAVAKARQAVVAHLNKESRLESVQFKYLINATRKYAIPLLDYLDKIGVTKRAADNTRYLGPKA
jgi:selenocysteine-specific elongation factor